MNACPCGIVAVPTRWTHTHTFLIGRITIVSKGIQRTNLHTFPCSVISIETQGRVAGGDTCPNALIGIHGLACLDALAQGEMLHVVVWAGGYAASGRIIDKMLVTCDIWTNLHASVVPGVIVEASRTDQHTFLQRSVGIITN